MEINDNMKQEEQKIYAIAIVSDSRGYHRARHLRLTEEKYKKLEERLNTTDEKGYTLKRLERMFS